MKKMASAINNDTVGTGTGTCPYVVKRLFVYNPSKHIDENYFSKKGAVL